MSDVGPRCVSCKMPLGDRSTHYRGHYYSAGDDEPAVKRFCSLPCLTRHAYNNTETVELPGGKHPDNADYGDLWTEPDDRGNA